MRLNKIGLSAILAAAFMFGTPAIAQTVSTQDISQQLQASLEATTPTIVYFTFDRDSLTEEAQTVLLQQASWLISNPEAKVNLAGHTDAVGSNEYNDNLAMRRARSVENFLVSQGVNPAQMQSVVSRGELDLAIPTEKREKLNRRVTTGVTGLVEIFAQTAPEPVYIPPPAVPDRSYTEVSAPNCAVGGAGSLVAMTDMRALRGELQTRLNSAAAVYASEAAIASTSNRFNLAAHVKAECGVAIGFTKSGELDERSVSQCACYSDALSQG